MNLSRGNPLSKISLRFLGICFLILTAGYSALALGKLWFPGLLPGLLLLRMTSTYLICAGMIGVLATVSVTPEESTRRLGKKIIPRLALTFLSASSVVAILALAHTWAMVSLTAKTWAKIWITYGVLCALLLTCAIVVHLYEGDPKDSDGDNLVS